MITSSAFAGKKYAVLGLARSGAASVEALLASGAEVTAWDRQDVARDPFAGRCELADPLEMDLTGFDGLVVSPGVPLNTHPIVAHAAKYGVPVIGDIELFALARADLPPHKVVGITGTNGKSTTTALVHHILAEAGVPSLMGGNIGLPIMSQLPLQPNANGAGVYVLELSSYQIDLTYSLDCDVAVLLNITPDHLDRYDGFEAYAASKARLFEMQWQHGIKVVGQGDPNSAALLERFFEDSHPILEQNPTDQHLWPSLQGPHNAQNAKAAIAVAFELNVSPGVLNKSLRSFKGLEHRMERTATHAGVLYVNDSKATNQASTAPALAAFPPDPAIHNGTPRVHWIVGGLAKEDGLGECADHLANLACAYTIGEAGPRFAEMLEPSVPVVRAELMQDAIAQAKAKAQSGDVILLSPACASFDQFRDFEKRGEHFRSVVAALIEQDTDEGKAA